MAVAAQLFQLEQLDSEIERDEATLADLRRRHGKNSELEAAEATVERLRAEQSRLSSEQRSLETDLADFEARIKRDDSRLYGGTIVDSREISSLQRELEHLRTQRDALEGQVLSLMERVEAVDADLKRQSASAAEMRRSWEAGRPEIARQHNTLRADLQTLRERREQLAGTIDPRSLSVYTRLRTASGHAVSHVSDGICQWCRVVIPPKDVQHARSTLVTCTNCSRILYTGA